MINNLLPFAFQPILPAVFDDSLSYMEMIAKLYNQVQSLTDAVNKIDIDAVTTALAELRTYVDTQDNTLQANIDNLDAQTQTQISTLYTYINGKLANVNASISSLRTEMLRDMDIKDEAVWAKCQAAIADVYKELEKKIELLPIKDPYKANTLQGIQTVVYDIFEYTRSHPITASQYDGAELTAQEYDNKFLTANEYDQSAGIIIIAPWNVFSGFTGKVTVLQDAYNEILQALRTDGITAQSYDAMNLTAEYYDGLGMSAYDYDFHGANIVPLGQ